MHTEVNGQVKTLTTPLRFGVDIGAVRGRKSSLSASLAPTWETPLTKASVFRFQWRLRDEEDESVLVIKAIDFFSIDGASAAPFLVAVTVE